MLALRNDFAPYDRAAPRRSACWARGFGSGALALGVLLGGGPFWAHGEQSHGADLVLSPEQSAIVQALNGYAAAVEAKDMTEIEAYVVMDDGFSYIEGTYVDLGWDSYRNHLAPEMALFENTYYEFQEVRPFVSGDLAYATMGYQMDVTIKSDQFESGEHQVNMKGQATAVLIKTEGSWKIKHMHTARAQEQSTPNSGH